MEKKIALGVNVNEINDTMSMMFSEMIGELIEYLDQLPNKKLNFEKVIDEAITKNNEVMKSMLPMLKAPKSGVIGYVKEIYLAKAMYDEYTEIYAKTNNTYDEEMDVNEQSFYWVLDLCEFIQT
ncbi:MAG: hypothetical protein K2H20_02955, partial [Bacilli bacterium]|nr:hypothetical protein [Bacilli bacterium]